ncbi:MAG: cytochrome P450 [Aeromicrobium sp.]
MTDTEIVPGGIEALRAAHQRDYNPYSEVTIQEHLDDIADRRENLPMSFSEKGGFWLATTYDDIAGMLRRNNKGFVSFPNIPDGVPAFGQKKQIPIELDGPVHAQYRKLLDPLFSPNKVKAMEDQVRQVAVDLVNGFAAKGTVDLVPEFAFPFPGSVFLSVMGWPLEDAEMMNEWVHAFLHGVPGGTEEETLAARINASEKSRAYIQAIVDDRRATPREDITSVIVAADFDGEPISDSDLSDLFILMMMAGLDTTASVIAQSMLYFARHPKKWDEMFADPDDLDDAIEELLRWTSPAVPTRNVDADLVEIGGLELPKGERIHCPLAAANRDPKYYPDPDEVIFDREPHPHLTFSLGSHRCIGLHLARQELRIAFEELRRVMPTFTLSPGCEPKEHTSLTWGVDDVKLDFEPTPAA